MFRTIHPIAICVVLAQLASSQAWSQTGATITDRMEAAQSSDAVAACRQSPTRPCVTDLAIVTIEAMNDASMRRSMLMPLAFAQARAGDTAGTLATLDRMQRDISNYSQILEELTKTQAAAGDIGPVLTAVAKIQNEFQRAFAFVKVAETSASAGNREAAREVFHLALVTGASAPSLESRAFFLASTADRAVASGDLETANEALALAWKLTKTAVVPDTRDQLLASIAITRAHMGEITRAMSVAETIEEPPARAAALTWIGEAQAKAGDLQASRDTLQRATAAVWETTGPGSHSSALVGIARAYVALDDRAAAETLLQAALAAAHRGEREWALMLVCEVQTEMGAANSAVATAEMIEESDADAAGQMLEIRALNGALIEKSLFFVNGPGNHDRAVGQIVKAQVKAGNLPLALEITKKMRDGFWRAKLWADMAKARAEAPDREEARTIIAAAVQAIGQIESDTWRARAMVDIAEAQAMVGDVAAAIATATAITKAGYRDRALLRIAVGVAKSGDTAAAEGISDPYARATILARLAGLQLDRGDRAGGLAVLRVAQSSAESIAEAKLRARALHQISEAQTSAGDAEGVRQTIIQALTLVGPPDNAEQRVMMSLAIAKAQANARDYVGALATASGMSDSNLRAHALLEIAAAFYH